MARHSKALPKQILSWLDHWVLDQRVATPVKIEPLAGDGSTRTFYRIRTPHESKILLFDPDWTFSKDYPAHQAYLRSRNIPVPDFETHSPEAGILLMQDLGDELLQFRIQKDPDSKIPWLKEAIRLLAHLHGATFPVPADIPCSTRRFDSKKYFEELSFTLEHLNQKYLELPAISNHGMSRLKSFCEEIGNLKPDVFSHRDYHTRNILLCNEQLYMIDFQDARLGSPHYDLVSLIYDPYVTTTDSEKETLLDLYKNEMANYPLTKQIDWLQWKMHLAAVAFQRLVKAAGSFASFYTRYGKETHLPYLMPALQAAQALQGMPGLKGKDLESALPIAQWIERLQKTRKKEA